MNVDELREQLQSAAQPPRPLVAPLQDLHRRGRRRRRRRSAVLAAGLAAVVGVVVGGTQYLGKPDVEPATRPLEPFPGELSVYRLADQEAGASGQTDFTPTVLATALQAAAGATLSITCTARDAEHRQVLVTSQGGLPQLVACSSYPTNPSTLGGFDSAGTQVVRTPPVRFRIVDLGYRLGETPPAAVQDPAARLAVAVYVP
ncbi:hypothetical protein [Kribbella sp. NPDC000426]|uniref:hypothetical protein n=1 Tax=Kribbella sp. NPDC000426 TaxID=3154255 RepID=UPI00331EB4C9